MENRVLYTGHRALALSGNGKAILSLALFVSLVLIAWMGFNNSSGQPPSSAIHANQIPASIHNAGDNEATSTSANIQPREDRGEFEVFQRPDADVEHLGLG